MRRRAGLLAVLAVIAAFLGMHSLAMPMPMPMPMHGAAAPSAAVASSEMTGQVAEPSAHMSAMDGAAIDSTEFAGDSTDAAGESSSGAMVGMACAMALLLAAAGIILMRARVLSTPRHDVLSTHGTTPPLVTFAGHPPSLTQLSISRT